MSDAMCRGRWSSRKVPLRFPQRSSRGHPKDPPQAPQGSAHGSPQGSAGPPEGSSEAAPPQGCPKGSPRVHLRVHPKIPPRVSPRAFPKAPPRVPPKGPPKGSAQRSPVCAWLSCGDGRGPKARVQYIYTTLRVSSWGGPKTLRCGAPRCGLSSFLTCLDGDSMCTYLVLGSMLTKSSYLDGDSDIVYIP